jgi:peptidoglycan/LPS O-acetylase OafA/YrhL
MCSVELIVIGRGEQARAYRVGPRMRYDRLFLDTGPFHHANAPGTAATPAVHAATASGGKLAELDGLRGVAAVIVVAWHFIFAFLPERIGILPPFDPNAGLVGNPAFALVDGPGAVMLFFVLSGYVLPLAYFRSGRMEVVLRAVAKRWFRLVGLTVTAAVFSYLLFHYGLYYYRDAATYTQSD